MASKPTREALLAAHDKAAQLRTRLFSRTLSWAEEQIVTEALQEADRAYHELVEAAAAAAAPPPPPVDPGIAKLTPGEAAEKAKAIRNRPEYWNPNPAGGPGITPEQHATLQRELVELDKRAHATEGSPT